MNILFFDELGNELVSCGLLEFSLYQDDENDFTDLNITVQINKFLFDIIKERGYFSFNKDTIINNAEFNNDKPVELYLSLRSELISMISLFGSTTNEVKQNLFANQRDDMYITIFQVGNWLLKRALQDEELPDGLSDGDSSLKIGYNTIWDLPEEERYQTMAVRKDNYIMDMAIDYLEEENIKFERVFNSNICTGVVKLDSVWEFYVLADIEHNRFFCYSICPYELEKSKYDSVIEFITRANSGLPVGNFEFDFEDGEIKFKTYVELLDKTLTTDMIEQTIVSNFLVMNKYAKALLALVVDGISTMEAISQVEE